MAKGLGLHNIHSPAQRVLASWKVCLSGRRGAGRLYSTVCGAAARLFSALGRCALRYPQATLRIICTSLALAALRLTYIAGVLHGDGPFALITLLVAVLLLIVAYGGARITVDDDMPAPHYRGTDFARDERARTLAAQQRGGVLLRRR